jgi:cellulose biosynthesis protein BcsQ
MIISLVQTKGGTGKSTLSQVLAFSSSLQKVYGNIGLVELDAQATLQRWWAFRADRPSKRVGFHHISTTVEAEIERAMLDVVGQHDLTIIDVPGESVSRFHTLFAASISDLVLVPMRTSTHDEDAFEMNLLPIVDRILARAPHKAGRFYILPTFTHPSANRDRITSYFREILPEHVGCLDAVFPNRVVFENFNREGMSLAEYAELVASNRRESKQVAKAIDDVEWIAAKVLEGALDHGLVTDQAEAKARRIVRSA